jgi:predicted GH43/DUF377 family glycosyl hydrolase
MGATIRHYVHFFANYDQTGKLIKISKGFVFEHLGTEFAAGIVEQGDDFLISYGSKDVSSHIARIKKSTVLQGLRKV